MNLDIFDSNGGRKSSVKKTTSQYRPGEKQLRRLRKLKPDLSKPVGNDDSEAVDLQVGTLVNHSRFGRGKVLKLEGNGHDKKAEIEFDKGQVKKLLLRFARLEIL